MSDYHSHEATSRVEGQYLLGCRTKKLIAFWFLVDL